MAGKREGGGGGICCYSPPPSSITLTHLSALFSSASSSFSEVTEVSLWMEFLGCWHW